MPTPATPSPAAPSGTPAPATPKNRANSQSIAEKLRDAVESVPPPNDPTEFPMWAVNVHTANTAASVEALEQTNRRVSFGAILTAFFGLLFVLIAGLTYFNMKGISTKIEGQAERMEQATKAAKETKAEVQNFAQETKATLAKVSTKEDLGAAVKGVGETMVALKDGLVSDNDKTRQALTELKRDTVALIGTSGQAQSKETKDAIAAAVTDIKSYITANAPAQDAPLDQTRNQAYEAALRQIADTLRGTGSTGSSAQAQNPPSSAPPSANQERSFSAPASPSATPGGPSASTAGSVGRASTTSEWKNQELNDGVESKHLRLDKDLRKPGSIAAEFSGTLIVTNFVKSRGWGGQEQTVVRTIRPGEMLPIFDDAYAISVRPQGGKAVFWWKD